jgi:pyruvate/2-oxoglutarate dehydrogenase complex dihydrolipoamide dehydrogenase (E3) component
MLAHKAEEEGAVSLLKNPADKTLMARYSNLHPRIIFCILVEVAAVGQTEERLKAGGEFLSIFPFKSVEVVQSTWKFGRFCKICLLCERLKIVIFILAMTVCAALWHVVSSNGNENQNVLRRIQKIAGGRLSGQVIN